MNEETLFAEAIAIESPEERSQFLDKACGGNLELRKSVEKLLQLAVDAGSFLEHPAEGVQPGPTLLQGDALQDTNDDPTIVESIGVDESLDFLGPAESSDSSGRLGQYDVIELIGRGGMGIVLKGRDSKLNRIVAIKVLVPELASNATARKRFLREAQAAAAVSHDHVVTIHAIDEEGRLPYLVMEFISGVSLQQRVDRDGPLDVKEILRIGKQTAAGLAAAHAEGLIHRDIKPANILLENGVERVKITDFGLARAVDDVSMTQTGVVAGTPQYMSPEQAQGQHVDHRSDLFSLGSVLYAMCTGRPPFRAETTVAVIRRVCDDTPRPIREVNADVPDWLAAIIDRLLAKQPDQRFQSAAEVANLLGGHLAHLQHPTSTPPPESSPQQSSPHARRETSRDGITSTRRWHKVAAAVVLLAVCLGVTEATGVTQFATTIIRLTTGSGTLVVEVDDPNVSVTIDGEEIVVTGAGPKEIRLKPGEYRVEASKGGKSVFATLVEVERDGKRVVRIRAEAAAPGFEIGRHEDEAPTPIEEITLLREFPRQASLVRDLALTPDGRYALSGHWGRSLVLWDVSTSSALHTFELRNTVGEIAVTPDGRLAVAGGDETLYFIDLQRRKIVREVEAHQKMLNAVALSPDGKRVVTGGNDRTAVLWDTQTGEQVKRLELPFQCYVAAFVPDGRHVVLGGSDGFCQLWDLETGGRVRDFHGHTAALFSATVSSDGMRLVTGCEVTDPTVRLWDVQSGRLVATFQGHTGCIRSVDFLPDRRHILSGCDDGTIRAWSVASGREVARGSWETAAVNHLALCPDGRRVLSAGGLHKTAEELSGKPTGDYALRLWQLPESLWPSARALSFDGQDDYVDIPTLKYDGSHPITIEALVTVTSIDDEGQWCGIVSCTGPEGGVALDLNRAGFAYAAAKGPAGVDEDNRHSRTFSDAKIPWGKPVHLTAVLDGERLRLYVDGELQSKKPATPVTGVGTPSERFVIAATPLTEGTKANLHGEVHEVRISKTARYDGPNYDTEDDLEADEHTLALYHFDEGQGDVLKDASGNGHHGKIVGATWVKASRPTLPGSDSAGPWVDLLATPELALQAAESPQLSLEDGSLVLTAPADEKKNTAARVTGWKGRNVRVRVRARCLQPQQLFYVSLSHKDGTPFRIGAMLSWHPKDRGSATLWLDQFDDSFDYIKSGEKKVFPLRIDKEFLVELELRDGNATARIGDAVVFFPNALDPARDVHPSITVSRSTWKITEWQVQELAPSGLATHQLTELRRFGDLHTRPLADLAYLPSAEGSLVAVSSYDGTVRVWNVETGREARQFLDLGEVNPKSVAASPDGETVVIGDHEGNVYVQDLASGMVQHTLNVEKGSIYDLAFSPDGKSLYVGMTRVPDNDTGPVVVYDTESWKRLREFENVDSGVTTLTPLQDNAHVLVATEARRAGIWDGGTGRLVTSFRDMPVAAYATSISTDGSLVALGFRGVKGREGRWDDPDAPGIWLYDAATGRVVRKLRGHTGFVNAVAFTADGRYLISGSGAHHSDGGFVRSWDNSLRVWDVRTGAEIARTELDTEWGVWRLALMPDGRHVVTASSDNRQPDLRLWRLPESVWPEPPSNP